MKTMTNKQKKYVTKGAGKVISFTAKSKNEVDMLAFKKFLEGANNLTNKEIIHVGNELLFTAEPQQLFKLKVCKRIYQNAKKNNVRVPAWVGKYAMQGQYNAVRNPLRRREQNKKYAARLKELKAKMKASKVEVVKAKKPSFFTRLGLAMKVLFGGDVNA